MFAVVFVFAYSISSSVFAVVFLGEQKIVDKNQSNVISEDRGLMQKKGIPFRGISLSSKVDTKILITQSRRVE
jgi:hypothetical protein